MKIKLLTKKDISKAIELYLKVWKDKNTDINELKKYFVKKVKNNEGYIAVVENKIVGFIGFTKEYFKIVCSKRKNYLDSDYLDWVFIDKDHRGKGLAEALIKKFEQDAKIRKVRRIFSTTIPKNKPAIEMHKKLGYHQVGYVWNIWEEGEKELFFSKMIKGNRKD